MLSRAAIASRVRPGSAVASPDMVFDAASGGWVPSQRMTEYEWAASDQGTNPAQSPVGNLNLRVKPTPQELLAKARVNPKLGAALRNLQLHGTAILSRYYFSDDRESMTFIQDLLDAGFQPPASGSNNAFSRPMSHYLPRAQASDPRSIVAQRPTGGQPAPPASERQEPPSDPYNMATTGVVVRGGWPVDNSYNTKPNGEGRTRPARPF